ARRGVACMNRIALLVLLALGACAPAPPLPPGARPDLAREWLGPGGYRWPPDNGFAERATFIVLPEGMLLDRFGAETGRFFSPRGAAFRARALPGICAALPYHAYRVTAPLLARVGPAAPWFDEPGGATQVMTDATAAQLLAHGTLVAVSGADAPCPR
ncbi:TNT domain-containing protein, partial [Aphanothece microscopica]|uniref:TNT domain-containing protein n=1 Tax=Aphanothece microscopica TaxID=1049561 RepID=UPI0039855E8F